MKLPKFDKRELEVQSVVPSMFGTPERPVFNYPIPMKQAIRAMFDGDSPWMIFGADMKLFTPAVIPDNLARAFCFENAKHPPVTDGTVPDMFGVPWEYVPAVGGSMVRPGTLVTDDAWELLEKVQWPDPDSWDWEGSARLNNGSPFLDAKNYNTICFLTGWFERLISLMEFENALMALYDEEQKEAVHRFFDRLSDLYIKILGRCCDVFPELDGFSIHDDWGSQRDTFFAPELVAEMIVPYMRRVTDYLHSRGKTCELHSCGQNLKQIPNMIAAGWDAWTPQPIVDTHLAYELYGDKIHIGIDPCIDPTGKTDDEMRAEARRIVDKFMQPGKSAYMGFTMKCCTRAFVEELYEYSRKKCGGEL